MLLPFLAFAFAFAVPQKPHAAPHRTPPCHALSNNQFREPLTLSEPCYTLTTYANVSAPITVNPGTIIFFGGSSALNLQDGGSLNAVGTAEKPIIFRGKEHAPGFWTGILFSSASPKNHLGYVTVEDAGPRAAAMMQPSRSGSARVSPSTIPPSATPPATVSTSCSAEPSATSKPTTLRTMARRSA